MIIQLSRQDGFVSEVIADWTREWPSHVDIVIPPHTWANDAELLLGARSDVHMDIPAGVQLRPNNYTTWMQTERIHFGAGDDDKFYDFLLHQIGKPYDKEAILGLALDRDWRCPDHWFCSELFFAAAEEGHYINRLSSPVNFLSPRDALIVGELMGTVLQ